MSVSVATLLWYLSYLQFQLKFAFFAHWTLLVIVTSNDYKYALSLLMCTHVIFFSRDREIWPITLTFKHDLDTVKMNRHAQYFGHTGSGCGIWGWAWSFSRKIKRLSFHFVQNYHPDITCIHAVNRLYLANKHNSSVFFSVSSQRIIPYQLTPLHIVRMICISNQSVFHAYHRSDQVPQT